MKPKKIMDTMDPGGLRCGSDAGGNAREISGGADAGEFFEGAGAGEDAERKKRKKASTVKAVMSYAGLMKMARDYLVADNALFVAAAKTYAEQAALIAQMRENLKESGMTVTKEYVKGRENLCINPLVQELPKHVDSANRTLSTMLQIITDIGRKPEKADELTDFLNAN